MKKALYKRFLGMLILGLVVCFILFFLMALSNLGSGKALEDKSQLEDALHRAAVCCYAIEGAYPPDLAYLETHYGIQIDRRHFTVSYIAIAENLMPDITVLEK